MRQTQDFFRPPVPPARGRPELQFDDGGRPGPCSDYLKGLVKEVRKIKRDAPPKMTLGELSAKFSKPYGVVLRRPKASPKEPLPSGPKIPRSLAAEDKRLSVWLLSNLRRAFGLCDNCGNRPPTGGTFHCDECKAKGRAATAVKRERRKAKGLCVMCGPRPAEDGRTMCLTCLEYMRSVGRREEYASKRYYSRKEAGLCPKCGDPSPEGKVYCPPCAKQAGENQRESRSQGIGREYANRRRAVLREAGLCIECSEPACLNQYGKKSSYCQKHLDAKRINDRRRRRGKEAVHAVG